MGSITEESRQNLLEILDSQKVAVLTTIGKDNLYSCLVSFEISRDLKTIFFATKRKRQKYENMLNDSRVSLVIDDHDVERFNLHGTNVISIAGNAVDYNNKDKDEFLQKLKEKHPYLAEFLMGEDTALILVTIEDLSLVDNFERVQRFR